MEQQSDETADKEQKEKELVPSLNTVTRETNKLLEYVQNPHDNDLALTDRHY